MNREQIERSVRIYKRTLKESNQCFVFPGGSLSRGYLIPSLFTPKEIDYFKKVWGNLDAEFQEGWIRGSELVDIKPIREAFECFLDLTLELSWT